MAPPVPPGDKHYPDDKDWSCKTGECTSSQPASHGRATFLTALIVAGSVLGFILCFSIFLFVRRRRQQRRRREALLEAAALAPAGPAATPDGGGPDLELEEAEQPGGEVVHHAWHIRTVGLDEAAIESIALTRYRAGAGASDCSVCLGEFADGELLRLLPRCAHAFHVSCIDTWLRAHVNCPLCRFHVLEEDPPAAAAAEQTDSPAGQAANDMDTTDRQASDRHELRLQIDQHDHDDQSTSPERPHRNPGPRGGSFSFRRAVSMDSPSPAMASAEETLPEDGQAGGEKQGTGGAVHSSPGAKNRHGIMKRSMSVGRRWALVSWHGSSRSSSFLPR